MNLPLLLIKVPNQEPGITDHWTTQAKSSRLLRKAGAVVEQWHHGQGGDHYWAARCTDEVFCWLALHGCTVEANLDVKDTESARAKLQAAIVSAKFTDREKEMINLDDYLNTVFPKG